MGKPLVEVEGARELRRTLKAAGDDLADLSAANAQVASYVAARASSKAPRVSGKLAGTVRGNKAKANASIKAGGAATPYAGPIHWGWAQHNISPNPFLVDAAHETEPTWTDFYMREIDKILSRVKGA